MPHLKIVECPRDAMQGIQEFIPTEQKIRYLNALLKVGFPVLDAGSFVSPKAIPQMRDTAEVLDSLDLQPRTKLLVIVANERGAEEAAEFEQVSYIGFPLSLSETFQQRNTNRSIAEAFDTLAAIQDICEQSDKMLVTYLSMGFGNPYGDAYDPAQVVAFCEQLDELEVGTISLADTLGQADPVLISQVCSAVLPKFPHIEFGAHFHSAPQSASAKTSAAWAAGCRRFDGALGGIGGCPMAADKLVGNMPTETLLEFASEKNLTTAIDAVALAEAQRIGNEIFTHFF